jgi:hypothetical protein
LVAGLSAHASSFSEIRKHPACPLEMRNQKASCLHAVCMLRVCNNNAVCTTLGLTRTSYIVYDHMYVYFNAKNMVYIHICEVGQNRISAPYMTVYLVIFLPEYRKYTVYIWFWPALRMNIKPTSSYLEPRVRTSQRQTGPTALTPASGLCAGLAGKVFRH